MRKRVQVLNLKTVFEYVRLNTFSCLADLEKQVVESDNQIESILTKINDNRDAIFHFKGVKIEKTETTFFYEFETTIC